jgi:hypothetical protein
VSGTRACRCVAPGADCGEMARQWKARRGEARRDKERGVEGAVPLSGQIDREGVWYCGTTNPPSVRAAVAAGRGRGVGAGWAAPGRLRDGMIALVGEGPGAEAGF